MSGQDGYDPEPEDGATQSGGPQSGAADGGTDEAAAAAPEDSTAKDSATETEVSELEQAQATAADLQDQLARRGADMYNLQQEYSGFVRRAKADAANQRQAGAQDVLESLLGVLDEVELARQHGDLTGPFAAIAEKLESTLGQRFELVRYGAVGEAFDPEVHEALMHETDEDAETATVKQVLQPGYRAGERVLRAARVAVIGPQ
ncbi:nucleotide exchange factor GrpE [Bogoriella caseilytica]|uniref:Protein GrpE n=1 Tax=Bogoriella caseilytica TaxID=56055 RepID=A0A3N2BBH5_9MICO|nr:nucleotide exchange factor GrpE [Bogoriella caseilytica]ROR72613.1 molecular chaperone GrpE [Bogoriella caseilytica]